LGNGGKCLGLVLTSQGAAGAPLRRCGRRGATKEASFSLFLLSRGQPRPRFSISAPVSRLTAPASAIGWVSLVKRNPR
jgi:hypothetical protein